MIIIRRAAWSLLFVLPLGACASAPPQGGGGGAAAADTDDAARRAQLRTQLDALTTAASRFAFENNRCPQSVDDLLAPPNGTPLIDAMPIDPWGQPIAFMPANEESPTPAFVSGGPDGALLTDDDVRASAPCSAP